MGQAISTDFRWTATPTEKQTTIISTRFFNKMILNNNIDMDNKIETENLISNKKRLFFIVIIIATIVIPQVIANQYNTEFAFGYPIGEEFQIAKVIAALIGVFLVYNFLQEFHLSKSFKVLLSIISLIPLVRLIIAAALCLLWKEKDNDSKNTITLQERIRDIAFLFIGYLCISTFIFGITGFLFLSETESIIINLLRVLISTLFFYALYKRKIYLIQSNLILYIVSTWIILFFIF